MGVGEGDRRVGLVSDGLAAVAVLAAAAAPLPWSTLPLLVGGALVPHPLAPALAAAGALGLGVAGPAGAVVLAAAGLLLALRRAPGALALAATAALLALKQQVAASVLPAAADAVPGLLVAGLAAAGGLAAGGGRAVRAALGVAALVGAVRLGEVYRARGAERLARAEAVGAVPLVYADLVRHADHPVWADRGLLFRLVAAAPDRDEAALAAGWEEALALGWRPARADGVEVPVARWLEARGRGGEALRLLARAPREGAVDWWRALYAREQGLADPWAGGEEPSALGMPGAVSLGWTWLTNQEGELLLTARRPLRRLVLAGEGTVADGPPEVEVQLDGRPVGVWAPAGPSRFEVPGPLDPGPHRLRLRFVNDRVGPEGDRNVTIGALLGE